MSARAVFAAGLPAFAGAAAAETIYRCGSDYARAPCPSARFLEIDADAAAARQTEARQVLLREQRMAERMTSDRRADEATHRPALAGSLGPAPKLAANTSVPENKSAKKRHKSAKPDDDRDFIAAVPKAKKARS